jgi:glycosyltransferase involved in cell wall biosynthesis
MMELVFQNVTDFDILHFHCDYVHFPLVRRYACPSVTTLHGFVHDHDLRGFLQEYMDIPLLSISNSQRASIPEANWRGTVYHGVPKTLHNFQPGPGEYLAFLGRISPEKGLERAIEIAKRTRVPLKIAAKIYDEDRSYFERIIQPLLNQNASFVEFIGEVGGVAKDEFLGRACALLFPVDWPEPFGLVMIEAMACGTPVIAWKNGSVPEVIEDGVTGFIVDNLEDAVRNVLRLGSIRRTECRRAFEERFCAERMAHDYLQVYEKIIRDGR